MGKDVAIIGGSTSGFYTAYLLAQRNIGVRVFEASENINPSSRTLIVTDHMREVLGKMCDDIIINRISRFELFANRKVGSVTIRRPDLIVERSSLIQKLAEQAESKGAKILTGQRFLELKPNGKCLTFSLSSNGKGETVEDSTEVLVGADGAFSKVAQSGGWPIQETVPLEQAVVELPEDMPSDTTRIWFMPEETPYFYWLIPHSPTRGVLGLIGIDESETRSSLEGFLDRKGMIPLEYQSAQIPLYSRWIHNYRKLGNSDVYLVGDAAGHVKVSTVGGIVTGFRGAMGVAESILNGGASRKLKELRRELNLHHLIRRMLTRFTQDEYIRLLDLLSPSAQQTLSLITRDETPKLLFHLFRKQPRLLFLGLKTLLFGR